MNVMLDVKPEKEIEDGSCLVKCLDVLFNYYNMNIHSYMILSISEIFDFRYRKTDYENGIPTVIDYNRSGRIEYFIQRKMNMIFIRKYFDSYKEGISYIFNQLNNKIPVCVGVNTYHLPYSEDYHKKYGGIFQAYHMMIIKGYDDNKKEFYAADPALNVDNGVIDFENFKLAWEEGNGIRKNFIPYTYYYFDVNKSYKECIGKKEWLIDIIKDNLQYYFYKEYELIDDEPMYHGLAAINAMKSDLFKLKGGQYELKFVEDMLNNIYNGIFHGIRWTRKSFALFLKKDTKHIKLISDDVINGFLELFDDWTGLSMRLYMAKSMKKADGFDRIIDELEKIKEKELYLVNKLLQQIN